MGHTKTAEIKTRLRELLEDGAGAFRAINASRFAGGLHEGQSEAHQTRLGILAQLPCETRISKSLPHPQRLVITGNVQIEMLEITVLVVRTVAIAGQVDDDVRDAIDALAAEDANVICQAFEWPPNLVTTTAGAATDLKGMIFQGSDHRLIGTAGKAMRLETIHRFEATAVSRPATT